MTQENIDKINSIIKKIQDLISHFEDMLVNKADNDAEKLVKTICERLGATHQALRSLHTSGKLDNLLRLEDGLLTVLQKRIKYMWTYRNNLDLDQEIKHIVEIEEKLDTIMKQESQLSEQ